MRGPKARLQVCLTVRRRSLVAMLSALASPPPRGFRLGGEVTWRSNPKRSERSALKVFSAGELDLEPASLVRNQRQK